MNSETPGTIWITDIAGQAEPATALAFRRNKPSRRQWLALPYQTESGIAGNMLYAPMTGEAPALRLKLPVRGWYRIFLGLASSTPASLGGALGIRVRLERDPGTVQMQGWGINWFWEMSDNLWRETELDQDVMVFDRVPEWQASLAWVRLEPMDEAEIAACRRRRDKSSPHCGITTNDGYWPQGFAEFCSALMPFVDSNVKKFFFCAAHGDVMPMLPTRVGTWGEDTGRGYMRTIDRDITLELDRIRREHPEALREMAELAHRLGLEFHASIRTGAFFMSGGNPSMESEFFDAHPEWHCRQADGTPVTRMSFAVSEVQEHFFAMIDELLAMADLDGINLIFIRALPTTLFEEPFIRVFTAEYGVDPRTLDEDDSRITAKRAAIMSEFIGQVRRRLDAAGARAGRRLELSLTVPATEAVNRKHGLALAEWIRAGWVDTLLVDGSLQDRFHHEALSNIEFDYFDSICRDSSCRYYPKMSGVNVPAEGLDYFRQALARGAAGYFLWDGNMNYAEFPYGWESIRLLGAADADEAENWYRRRPVESRLHLLKTLDGYDAADYPAHVAY